MVKRMSFWIQLALALIAVISLVLVVRGLLSKQQAAPTAHISGLPTPERLDMALVAAGQSLYADHCAWCHGASLQGGLYWQTPLKDGSIPPPPLNATSQAWQRSDAVLMRTISDGRNAGKLSAMPAYGDLLQPEEIRALVEFIKSTWGTNERIQQQQLK